jgi:hypothetical protein
MPGKGKRPYWDNDYIKPCASCGRTRTQMREAGLKTAKESFIHGMCVSCYSYVYQKKKRTERNELRKAMNEKLH